MFRHGLRVSEACGLNLSQVDTENRILHVIRLKKGLSTTYPLRSDEIRVIKTWYGDQSKESIHAGKNMRVSDRMLNRPKAHSKGWQER
jgi:integrase